MKWACALTTVLGRATLEQSAVSIAGAGFEAKQFTDDGAGAFATWARALADLYVSCPHVDRYAIFQDDIVLRKETRDYLERCTYPKRGYLNLYLCANQQPRWPGWQPSLLPGQGAQALVFDEPAVLVLLTSQGFWGHAQQPAPHCRQDIDGTVWFAMQRGGFEEWIHRPSLCQHIGRQSTLGNAWHEADTFHEDLGA